MFSAEINLANFNADDIMCKTIVDNHIVPIKRMALVVEVEGTFFEVPAKLLNGEAVVKGVKRTFYEELKHNDNILKNVEIRLPYGRFDSWFAIPRVIQILREVKVVEAD